MRNNRFQTSESFSGVEILREAHTKGEVKEKKNNQKTHSTTKVMEPQIRRSGLIALSRNVRNSWKLEPEGANNHDLGYGAH